MTTEMVLDNTSSYTTLDYDGLWEKLIRELFEEFMLFFAPDLYEEINFSKNPRFLQQGLYQEIIDKEKDNHASVQLIQVSLKSGKKIGVLIHIGFQDNSTQVLSHQMLHQFHERFDQGIYPIAIIMSDKRTSNPSQFNYPFSESKMDYYHNVYHFHEQDIVYLEQSSNPFAAAVIAGIYLNQSTSNLERRYYFKRKLMMRMLKGSSTKLEKSRSHFVSLFYFIDHLLKTPEELKEKLRKELTQFIEKEEIEQRNFEKGKREALHDFVHELIRNGFTDHQIIKFTKLTLEEVIELKKSL